MSDVNFVLKNDDDQSDVEQNEETQLFSVELDNTEGVDGKNKDDFLESESEEDFIVTIGEIKSNVSFQNKLQNSATNVSGTASAVSKLELDSAPNFKGTQIYDLDLASMEDKPWRKPGADITDYFNYGFNEETWNQYCERQKKLRSEYGGNQEAVNRAIFSSISLSGTGPQLSTMTGGRQLVNILATSEKPKINKVIIDLSKPPPLADTNQPPIIRTIISGSGAVSHNVSDSTTSPIVSNNNLIALGGSGDMSSAQISTISTTANGGNNNALMNMTDFSKPPPNASKFSQPPPQTVDFAKPPPATTGNTAPPPFSCLSISSLSIKNECPPGIDEPEPPGVSTPPPGISSISTIGFNPTLSGFNPAVPPPGVGNTADRIEAVSSMSVPPPSIYNQHQYQPGVNTGSAGFGPPPNFSSRPISLLSARGSSYNTLPPGTETGGSRSRGYEKDYKEYKDHSSGDSNDESYRRKRRRRSRSGSGERLRRRKDDRDRDRERDYSSRRYDDDSRSSKRKSDRDKERSDKKRSTTRIDEKDITDDRERKRKKHEKEKLDKLEK